MLRIRAPKIRRRFPTPLENAAADFREFERAHRLVSPAVRSCPRAGRAFAPRSREIFALPTSRRKRSAAEQRSVRHIIPHSEIRHDPDRPARHDQQNEAGKQDKLEIIHLLSWWIDMEEEAEMNNF